jgi:PAS domain-containing protein
MGLSQPQPHQTHTVNCFSQSGEHHEQHALLELLPTAVYTVDEAGRIDFYNQAAAELWGHAPEINRDLWCGSLKIFHPDGSPMPLKEPRGVRA